MIRFLRINDTNYVKPETIKNIEIRETIDADEICYYLVFAVDGYNGGICGDVTFGTVDDAHKYLEKIFKIYELNNL